jgi:hypothetical protein
VGILSSIEDGILGASHSGNDYTRILIHKEKPNAGLQQPKERPDDGQHTLTEHQTGMREAYAKTGECGFGLLQGIVSNANVYASRCS